MGCLPLTYEKTSPSTDLRVVYRWERLNQGHPGMKGSKNLGKECLVFGMMQPGRSYNAPNYRYGFNGKEKDDEVTGVTGVTYDYGFRIYDSRIGKFLSVDPLTKKFPWYTPYQFAGNKPIWALDLDGLEEIYYFTAQRKKFAGLDQVVTLLNNSGIMRELQKKFEAGNKLTDIYINVRPLSSNERGKTNPIYIDGINPPKNGIKLYQNDAAKDIDDTKDKEAQLWFITERTLKKGKTAIFVDLSDDLVKKAGLDIEAVKKLAFTIVHEILIHAIDEKDRKDDIKTGKEHKDFYNDPEYYEKNSDETSPAYEDVKNDSEAGKYKDRIEKAATDFTN
jgi:RHS repeat-associated protein